MTKITTFCILILSSSFFSIDAHSIFPAQQTEIMTRILDEKGVGFANLEHQYFGDQVILKFTPDEVGKKAVKLTLPNGLKLTYGEIVMFAGDMFGDNSFPISHCPLDKQSDCFYKQFDALAKTGSIDDTSCSNPYNQVSRLKDYLNEIDSQLTKAREQGETDWDFYSKVGGDMNKSLNRLTCGGSKVSAFIPFGSYLSLAQRNFDHFAPDAITAYRVGHSEALQEAVKAHELAKVNLIDKANESLQLAYAKNAFATHFLTDSLSSGHMRTPRRPIHDQIKLPAILKLLIANFMHDEDNRHGLEVVNAKGMSWRAYGDGYYFKPDAKMHRYIMTKVVQLSADSVYDAFLSGTLPSAFWELDYLPILSKIPELNHTAPLFKVEHDKLLARKHINQINNHEYTATWNGLLKLIELELGYDKSIKDIASPKIFRSR